MSARSVTHRVLSCDSHACTKEYEGRCGEDNRKVRAAAKRAGWRYEPGHPVSGSNRDWCPEHAGER